MIVPAGSAPVSMRGSPMKFEMPMPTRPPDTTGRTARNDAVSTNTTAYALLVVAAASRT